MSLFNDPQTIKNYLNQIQSQPPSQSNLPQLQTYNNTLTKDIAKLKSSLDPSNPLYEQNRVLVAELLPIYLSLQPLLTIAIQNAQNAPAPSSSLNTPSSGLTTNESKLSEMQNLNGYLTQQINTLTNNNSTNTGGSSPISLDSLKKLREQLLAEIQKTQLAIQTQNQLIDRKNQDIIGNESKLARQQQEIEYKKNLLLTRDRMLELSQEKNVYKKKVIFSLLATIFAIILMMVLTFFYFRSPTTA